MTRPEVDARQAPRREPTPAERSTWRQTHHPARFWSREGEGEDAPVRCHLSPRGCRLRPGQRGFCGVRQNLGGELRSLNYGKAVQATQEFVETEAVYHYAPGAPILSLGNLGCMMNCDYCHNWTTSQARFVDDADVRLYTPASVVERCLELGIRILSWTYNDPVVWQEFVVDTARMARLHGIRNLYKSALYIQAAPLDELIECMDIFSVSLKSMDQGFYRRLTKGELAPVLAGIERIAASGRHLEISNLMVTDGNDSEADALRVARYVLDHTPAGTPLHFVRFHPDYKMTSVARTPIDRLERAREAALALGVRHVYLGNVADHPGLDTRCPGCRATVLMRRGSQVVPGALDPLGHCRDCGAGLDLAALDLARIGDPGAGGQEPDSPWTSAAVDAPSPEGTASLRHAWGPDILSLHVVAANPGPEPAWVRWRSEGRAARSRDRIRVPGLTTHRFVVARASREEVAVLFDAAPGSGLRLEVVELLDRAHFPGQPV